MALQGLDGRVLHCEVVQQHLATSPKVSQSAEVSEFNSNAFHSNSFRTSTLND